MGEDKVKHQGWVASLSNGETVFQTDNVPGERTAWGKLQDRCAEEGIFITQIQLQLYGNTLVGIPNADGYTAFYEQTQAMNQRGDIAVYQGIGSVIGDWVVCMFTNASHHVWTSLRQITDMIDHCQLKPAHARRPRMPRPLMSVARVQAIDISDKDEIPELSEDDHDKVIDWFRLGSSEAAHADKDNEAVAYILFEETGVNVDPSEIEEFRLAFWS